MQPANSKHGPVSDEALAKETRATMQGNKGSRIEDWLDPEPPGDDEPVVDHTAGTQDTVDRRAIELRSEITAALGRSVFPANRRTLLEHADAENASDQVRDLLSALPADRTFRNVEEVWERLGEKPDARRF